MTNVLNMEVVEELLSLTGDDDPELLLDLIGMFLEDAPSPAEEIQEVFESGDMQKLSDASHSLKGSAGNLGVVLLQNDCDVLQVAGRSGAEDTVRDCMPNFQQHFADAVVALEELKGRYSS